MADVALLRLTVQALADSLLAHQAATALFFADQPGNDRQRHAELVQQCERSLAVCAQDREIVRNSLKSVCIELHPPRCRGSKVLPE
jgi:hypothetical protein